METGDERTPDDLREGEERAQRLAALRALAERTTQIETPARASARPGSPLPPVTASSRMRPRSDLRRRASLLLSGLLVVALVAAGVGVYEFTHRSATSTASVPAAFTLDLTKSQLYCPSSVAWSPDSTRLAVMAMTSRCGAPSSQSTSALAIYDATTGKLLRRVEAGTLLEAFGWQGALGTPHWSPDGATITLDAVLYPKTGGNTFTLALALVPVGAGTIRLIDGPTYDATTARALPVPIWDVTGGKVASLVSPTLPLALSYRWLPNGGLIPHQPLAPDSTPAPLTPGALSRWHSGTLEPVPALDQDGRPEQNAAPIAWFLNAAIPAWSPDARYFTELTLATRLLPSGTKPGPLTTGVCAQQNPYFAPICAQPGAVAPDAGLAAALAAARTGHPLTDSSGASYGSDWVSVSVDWRPDGKVLAALLPADGFLASDQTVHTVKVTLFDTGNGNPLGTLSAERPNANGTYIAAGVPYTAWSPNGERLALVDFFSSRLTMWGGASLPH